MKWCAASSRTAADDTRRLEHLIRSRQAPESISGYCPPALEAVIAKLLAPYPADRYSSPAEIYADLASAQAGQDTRALAEGWPHDEPADEARRWKKTNLPTRRTGHDEAAARQPNGDELPTRRTAAPEMAASAGRRPSPLAVQSVASRASC